MVGGPNGSGKSTLINRILRPDWLGTYLNPDDIERNIRTRGFFSLAEFGVLAGADEALKFFRNSTFLRQAGLGPDANRLTGAGQEIHFAGVPANSYFASVAVDFMRRQLLSQEASFTLETVMSSRDKVEFLEHARTRGYRTYLYFVATEDPAINLSRVRSRVGSGGHGVPEDKVVGRYVRSLALLPEAIRHTDRAYIFDNSGGPGNHTWLAEITGGRSLELKTDRFPDWFKRAVLDKVAPA